MKAQEEYSYDPFQLQNSPIKQKFSLPEKVMAIVLVVIFMMIPLYTISSDAFKANYVYKQEPSAVCGLYFLKMYPYEPTEFKQGPKN
ncbi:hypothetical protein [uncultured Kordia sp.]|uniref:hypothetical protein n=1 Tax=uncultured Kordia sp. TaxID=507699 RepID=UPI00261F4F90|nr:hypothetical protein [uncultured Kordia sp.]